MSLSARIDGFRELDTLLKKFPERIQRDIVNAGASAGAAFVRKEAKKNLRQNGSDETGTLYKAIKSKKERGVHGVYLVFTDNTAPHARLVEYGTEPRKLKKPIPFEIQPGQWIILKYTGSAPAKPFFRPAMYEKRQQLMRTIAEKTAARMDKEATKMAQKYRTLSKTYRRKLQK